MSVKVHPPTITIQGQTAHLTADVDIPASVEVHGGFVIDGIRHTVLRAEKRATVRRIKMEMVTAAPLPTNVKAWAQQQSRGGGGVRRETSAVRVMQSGQGGQITDPRGLVWSTPFAVATGLVALVIVAAGIATAGFAVAEAHDANQGVQLVTSYAATVGVVAGLATAVAGTWVVLLEMRGRAPNEPAEGATTIDASIAADASKLTELIKALGQFRAPLLAIVVGALLMLASIYIAADVAKTELCADSATACEPPG